MKAKSRLAKQIMALVSLPIVSAFIGWHMLRAAPFAIGAFGKVLLSILIFSAGVLLCFYLWTLIRFVRVRRRCSVSTEAVVVGNIKEKNHGRKPYRAVFSFQAGGRTNTFKSVERFATPMAEGTKIEVFYRESAPSEYCFGSRDSLNDLIVGYVFYILLSASAVALFCIPLFHS